MKILFNLLLLTIFALLGGLIYAFTVNILIMLNLIPTENLASAFGYEMTNRAVLVWIGSIIMGFIGIFLTGKWRALFLGLPIILPSLYAVLYTLSLN